MEFTVIEDNGHKIIMRCGRAESVMRCERVKMTEDGARATGWRLTSSRLKIGSTTWQIDEAEHAELMPLIKAGMAAWRKQKAVPPTAEEIIVDPKMRPAPKKHAS